MNHINDLEGFNMKGTIKNHELGPENLSRRGNPWPHRGGPIKHQLI